MEIIFLEQIPILLVFTESINQNSILGQEIEELRSCRSTHKEDKEISVQLELLDKGSSTNVDVNCNQKVSGTEEVSEMGVLEEFRGIMEGNLANLKIKILINGILRRFFVI